MRPLFSVFLLLLAKDDFTLAYKLVVEPQAVLVGRGFAPGTGRAAEQANAGWRLKHVRGKRAAVHVKFDAQVSRVGNPGDLVAGIQYDRLWNESYENRAFRHSSPA